MDQSVTCENRRSVDFERISIVSRNAPPCFLEDPRPAGYIPGVQAAFPEPIKPAARDRYQIHGCRTVTAHALCVQNEIGKVSSKVATAAHIIRKARADKRPVEFVNA